jgi:hypothetical protein
MQIAEDRRVFARNLAEVIDRLITVQLYSAGGGSFFTAAPVVQRLYDAARALFGEPLTYLGAVRLLEAVGRSEVVLISTGFIVPIWLRPEADGPIGAASLARALDLAAEARAVIVTEAANVGMMEAVCRASGLQVDGLEAALATPRKVAVVGFPLDHEAARREATRLLDTLRPKAIVTVEKPSWNEKRVHHNGYGFDVSAIVAKVDYLIEQARERGILTVGIGDGGNEIGMGCIPKAVKAAIPTATKCVCPCGAGIAAATATDLLVVGTIANWACYGIEACLAALLGAPHILHDPATERRLLEAAAQAGMVDPVTGLAEARVDGLPAEIHVHLLDILARVLELKMTVAWGAGDVLKWVGRKDEVAEGIRRLGASLALAEAGRLP